MRKAAFCEWRSAPPKNFGACDIPGLVCWPGCPVCCNQVNLHRRFYDVFYPSPFPGMSLGLSAQQDVNAAIREIAVIAVHGVGDPGADHTVAAIANLLTEFAEGAKASYLPFQDARLHLRVCPLDLQGSPAHQQQTQESFHNLSQGHVAGAGSTDTGISFMWTALRGGVGGDPRQTYSTLRLESRRIDRTANASRSTVNMSLYELYWADLSRPGRGAIRMLGELYQILFHLCRLGRHAVDAAVLAHQGTPAWKRYGKVQSAAVQVFTIPIAILNLQLAAIALGVLLLALMLRLPAQAQAPAVWCLAGILLTGLLGALLVRFRAIPAIVWGLPPFVLLAWMSIGSALLVMGILRFPHEQIGAAIAYGIAAAIAAAVIAAYNRPIPNAAKFGGIVGALLVIGLVIECLTLRHDAFGPVAAGLHMIELCLASLWLCWALFLVLCWGACIAGWWAVTNSREQRDRRVAWTARLTLASSAAGFTLATLALWAALALVGSKLLPATMEYRPSRVSRLLGGSQAKMPVREIVHHLLGTRPNYVFSAILALSAASLLLAAWGLGPVVFDEVRPPSRSTGHRRIAQGRWLDNAFALLRVAGELLYFGIAVVYPVGVSMMVWSAYSGYPTPAWLTRAQVLPVLFTAGGLLAGAAAGVFAFRGRLDKLALGFRPVLEAVLDVDNYLRQDPAGNNPRSHITSRYASLLRHICNWRNPSGDGYDALIIIAHSQGTVITADLLRFLKRLRATGNSSRVNSPGTDLRRLGDQLPIYLFTMGCPLRQLYLLRFPHLYEWVGEEVTESHVIPENAKPAPDELGVQRWVNAFRSGDYVGRALWRRSADAIASDTAAEDSAHSRREFCAGSGAHTHYWDQCGRTIAAELDRLIQSAAHASG